MIESHNPVMGMIGKMCAQNIELKNLKNKKLRDVHVYFLIASI